MKYYAIGELDVIDPAWVDEYIANVTGLVQKFGGAILARTAGTERLAGSLGQFMLVPGEDLAKK